ncbi:nucleoside deoxyribosyltransferase [Arthrobacter phage Emotion]|uniref:Nucleoside deoxyribosyltransferase n=1 Tax=Arthrobacter phage Emotion TaxID=3038361 RepID=A0AA49ERX3_9CAUD|nr:nucleoside deoxyribosyltransferase [Arthrobacter phage Emotion]
MRLYLAGPMTGYPRWNFDAFHLAAAALRAKGYTVLSPAEMDLTAGFDPDAPVEEFTLQDRQRALRNDLRVILDRSDAIAVLPDWEKSAGASIEVAVAKAIGRAVLEVDDLLQADLRTFRDLEVYPV